jgi:alpha-N-acetylglucosaminidase
MGCLIDKLTQELQPNVTGLTNRTGHHGTRLFYDPREVASAWNYLITAVLENPSLLDVQTFHYDMVDITRQVFANTFITLYNDLISSWKTGNRTQVQSQGLMLIDFLIDLDSVLATDEPFILGKWIADARRWSNNNNTYADYLEYNARNQVHTCPSEVNLIDNDLGTQCSNQRLRIKTMVWLSPVILRSSVRP